MKKKLLISSIVVTLLIIVLATTSGGVKKEKRKEEYYQKSLEARMQFDYQTSLEFLHKAFELDPDDYIIMADLAIDYSVTGKKQKAIELLEKALPQFDEAERNKYKHFWSNLAGLYNSVGETDKALNTYQETLQIDSDYYEANLNLGNILVQLNKPQEAAKYLEKAQSQKPRDRGTLVNLGSLYYRLGDFKKAESYYLSVLDLKTVQVQDYLNLGWFYENTGEQTKAEKYYLRAVEELPESTRVLGKVALHYYKNNKMLNAKEYFKKILEIDPDSTQANLYMGIISFNEKNYLEAIRHLLKVEKQESNDMAVGYLGYSYYYTQDYENALIYFNKFISSRKKLGDDSKFPEMKKTIEKIDGMFKN